MGMSEQPEELLPIDMAPEEFSNTPDIEADEPMMIVRSALMNDQPVQPMVPKRPFPWRDLLTVVVMVALIAVGYWMRAAGRSWDDYTHLHPDERFLTDIASTMRSGRPLKIVTQAWASQQEQIAYCNANYGLPQNPTHTDYWRAGKGPYFDARCSDINPNNTNDTQFVYGEFPVFTVRAIAEAFNQVTDPATYDLLEDLNDDGQIDAPPPPPWADYNGIHLVGRAISSVYDTLSILLVFLIGARLFGRWYGLLGATLYTFAVFPIQQSHFWTVDAATSFWVVLGIYFAVRVMDNAQRYAERFSPLPWIVGALSVWLLDMRFTSFVPPEAGAAYLALFGLMALVIAYAHERKNLMVAIGGWLLVTLILLTLSQIHLVESKIHDWESVPSSYNLFGQADGDIPLHPLISLGGALAASAIAAALAALWMSGWQRYLGTMGTFPWLAAALGLWVYDGLANYRHLSELSRTHPDFGVLVIYLLMMTAAAMFSAGLRYARRYDGSLFVAIGTPLIVLWAALMLAAGMAGFSISLWGLVAAIFMALLLSGATYWGYQDELAFGLAFGAALAGRINTLPLVGVLLLALVIRSLPLLDWRVFRYERNEQMMRVVLGLLLAGFATFLTFRFLNPHAFEGPSVLGLKVYRGWTDAISNAQFLVSGNADIPPNWQWANRTKWLFPLQNTVRYGLGTPLGLTAWGAFAISLVMIARARRQWTRLAVPTAWVLVYFGWLGQNWVTTMRYFLPIYAMLCLFAAWGLIEGLRTTYRLTQTRFSLLRLSAFGSTAMAVLFVVGHTLAYGYNFDIHRLQLTRVAASRYMQEHIPGDFGLYIEKADGTTRMVSVPIWVGGRSPELVYLDNGDTQRVQLKPPQPSNVVMVSFHFLGDPSQDDGIERLRIRLIARTALEGDVTLAGQLLEVDLSAGGGDALGTEYTVLFDPPTTIGESTIPYFLEVEVLEGGPVTFATNNGSGIGFSHLTVFYHILETGEPYLEELSFPRPSTSVDMAYFSGGVQSDYEFTANATGVINHIVIPHVVDALNDPTPETVRVILRDNRRSEASGTEVMGVATGDFNAVDDGHLTFGPEVTLELDEPFSVEAGQRYTLTFAPDDWVGIGGAAVAWEGPWDDPLPTPVCPVPIEMTYRDDLPSGMCTLYIPAVNLYTGYYIGITMNMFWPDEVSKRDQLLTQLNQMDYLIVGSNRFYDSLSRIPTRWPMTNRYYDALFSGELGFEVVRIFTAEPSFGPFKWQSQVLPTDNLPNWRNELEAEEAFHVYDHPAVFLFHKTPAYSPEKAAAILEGVNIRSADDAPNRYVIQPINRIKWGAPTATLSQTALQFTDEQLATQRAGGTWSDLFSRFYERNQVLAVIIWWALMVGVGWLCLPLLEAAFAGLPDRGFAAGKLVGWLLVAWTAWFGGTLTLPLWSQRGLGLLLVGLALFNAGIAFIRRQHLLAFIRDKWRHLLIIEGLALVMFLFFIGVRLGNPDLWHSSFGGEKPMNLAYFNGVLRSTIFPPIDPWYADGYINYYYWGYVLVGAPTKLLGVPPSLAYNLLLPTLFSMTGMGAFSVAYNLVAWTNERRRISLQPSEREAEYPGPSANPYVAGIIALLLAVVLGNLDTVRIFTNSLAQVGGYAPSAVLRQSQIDAAVWEFQNTNGRLPNQAERAEIEADAKVSFFTQSREWFSALTRGFKRVARGEQPLSIAAHRWYWGPTRVIAELDNGRGHNAIAEMPYFTFLYGDMHAHMLAMPLTLLVMLWLTAEILGAGRRLRGAWAAGLALLIGGITVGLLRPTNTWDWPTYMLLTVVGLTYAAWVGQGRLQRGLQPVFLYQRLLQFLDIRHVMLLWPLLLALPLGMVLRGGLYLYETRQYENKLTAGQIPDFCRDIDARTIDPLSLSPLCEGKLKPYFSIGETLVWGVGLFGLIVALYAAGLLLLGHRFHREALLAWVARIIGFGVISFVAIWPFNSYFATAYGEILKWERDRTPLWAYLDIHGVFIFITVSMLIWQTTRWLRRHHVEELRRFGVPLLAVVGLIPLTALVTVYLGLDYPVYWVTLPMLVWLAILFLLPDQSHVERWVYTLAGLALALSMAVEYVVLRGDIGRQNTVFKFYIQIWLLFSVASGVSLAWMLRSVARWRPALSGVWQMTLAILLSIAMLYPITATQGRFVDRFNQSETPLTLDGSEFMKVAPHGEDPDGNGPIPGVWFNLNGDYQMIRWVQDHVKGTPVIIEGQHIEYSWSSRIAIQTGLPTILGWRFHQSQQRNLDGLDRLLNDRLQNIRTFYTTTDIGLAWSMIAYYDVEYVIVGTFERIIYEDIKEPDVAANPATFRQGLSKGLAKFDEMVAIGLLTQAYEQQVCVHPNIRTVQDCPPDRISTDVIYQVVPNADYPQQVVQVP